MFKDVHVRPPPCPDAIKVVSLDGGPAPYIVMPFMGNGSLLGYLKKNRKSLVISQEDADDRESVSLVDAWV